MKKELVYRHSWPTRHELETAVFDYIEHFHNTRRRHSALGMRTPAEVEAEWFKLGSERHLAKTALEAGDVQPLATGLSGRPGRA